MSNRKTGLTLLNAITPTIFLFWVWRDLWGFRSLLPMNEFVERRVFGVIAGVREGVEMNSWPREGEESLERGERVVCSECHPLPQWVLAGHFI